MPTWGEDAGWWLVFHTSPECWRLLPHRASAAEMGTREVDTAEDVCPGRERGRGGEESDDTERACLAFVSALQGKAAVQGRAAGHMAFGVSKGSREGQEQGQRSHVGALWRLRENTQECHGRIPVTLEA